MTTLSHRIEQHQIEDLWQKAAAVTARLLLERPRNARTARLEQTGGRGR